MKTKLYLAEVAEKEAQTPFFGLTAGKTNIEPIVALFPKWNVLSADKMWCAAFVYYCVRKAGFEIPYSPDECESCSLAGCGGWEEFALKNPQIEYYKADDNFCPQKGDIVLFDRVFENKPHDHIGIVLENTDKYILSAEGNVSNQNCSGIVRRKKDEHVRAYIRIPDGYAYNPSAHSLGEVTPDISITLIALDQAKLAPELQTTGEAGSEYNKYIVTVGTYSVSFTSSGVDGMICFTFAPSIPGTYSIETWVSDVDSAIIDPIMETHGLGPIWSQIADETVTSGGVATNFKYTFEIPWDAYPGRIVDGVMVYDKDENGNMVIGNSPNFCIYLHEDNFATEQFPTTVIFNIRLIAPLPPQS